MTRIMTHNDRYIALVALGDAAGIWDMQNYGSAIGFSGVIFSMYVAVWARQAGSVFVLPSALYSVSSASSNLLVAARHQLSSYNRARRYSACAGAAHHSVKKPLLLTLFSPASISIRESFFVFVFVFFSFFFWGGAGNQGSLSSYTSSRTAKPFGFMG